MGLLERPLDGAPWNMVTTPQLTLAAANSDIAAANTRMASTGEGGRLVEEFDGDESAHQSMVRRERRCADDSVLDLAEVEEDRDGHQRCNGGDEDAAAAAQEAQDAPVEEDEEPKTKQWRR